MGANGIKKRHSRLPLLPTIPPLLFRWTPYRHVSSTSNWRPRKTSLVLQNLVIWMSVNCNDVTTGSVIFYWECIKQFVSHPPPGPAGELTALPSAVGVRKGGKRGREGREGIDRERTGKRKRKKEGKGKGTTFHTGTSIFFTSRPGFEKSRLSSNMLRRRFT